MSIRVLVIDDHPAVLEGIVQLLSSQFSVVATASDGAQMLDAFASSNPDVIVTDVTMSKLSGIEASRQLLARHPRTPIVVLTIHREPEIVRSAFDAGVMAYVHKLSAGDDLIPAVHAALAGQRFISDCCKLSASG